MSTRGSTSKRAAPNRFGPHLEALEQRSLLSVVTTTEDNGNDADPTRGSLRAAIIEANGTHGHDTITFNLGPADPGRVYYKTDRVAGRVDPANVTPAAPTDDFHLVDIDPDWPHSWWSIRPPTPLPEITEAVTIDGTTQPSGRPNESPEERDTYLRVELDGEDAGPPGAVPIANGLLISGGGSTVRGLVINRFSASGIHLQTAGGNVIERNFVGIDISGTLDLGNTGDGVLITSGDNNKIGGPTGTPGTGLGNVISANDENGVALSHNGENTLVQGNIIGLNARGTKPLGNTRAGFRTTNAGAQIGGADSMARNVISSNEYGILLSNSGSSFNTLIHGNYIGTDIGGNVDFGNTADGVNVGSAPGTRVGGAGPGEGNVISGNFTGVHIGGISHPVIDVMGRGYNSVVQGNIIGLNAAGTAALANTDGIVVSNSDNLIGGLTPSPGSGAGNVISGNDANGISLRFNGSSTVVHGNIIGLDRSGTVDLGNGSAGLRTVNAGTRIGGAEAGARNVISGNQYGILLSNSGSAYDTFIHGNYVGTDITGVLDLGNSADGVNVGSAPGTRVGGGNPGEGNVISGNQTGVFINGISHPVIGGANCMVLGNIIGLNAAGTAPVSNTTGVVITNSNNLIGFIAPRMRNVISGNTGHGIHILHETAVRNQIIGNAIGTNASGTSALGNSGDGVRISDGAADNLIGVFNAIAFNGQSGVRLSNTKRNFVGGFSVIYKNVQDGISLENADDNTIWAIWSGSNRRDGIRVDRDSAGNTIADNVMVGNGEHDCHDDSEGVGDAGTANVWRRNRGLTENRRGLCRPF